MAKDRLAGFPPEFTKIILEYRDGLAPAPLVCIDRAQAVNIRHRFHKFRRVATELDVPGARESWGLYLRLDGNKVLFLGMPAGMEITPPAPDDGLHVPGIDKDREPGMDEHDRKLAELFKLDLKPQATQSPTERVQPTGCQHEWDSTDTFCLHCKVPKPE